jgi:ATP-dependent Clp protease ATP-binding subunit ClpC
MHNRQVPLLPEHPEAVRAFLEAEDIADKAGQPLSSAHLLLAFFCFPNRAQTLLAERAVDEDRIIAQIRVLEDEPKRTVQRLRDRARDIARSVGAEDVDCLHVLIAITRLRDAFAYRLLEKCGASVTALRNIAVSYVTGTLPRRFRSLPNPTETTTYIQPASRPSTRTAPPVVLDEGEEQTGTRELKPRKPPPPLPPPPPTRYGRHVSNVPGHAAKPATATTAVAVAEVAPEKPRPKLEELAPTLAACGIDLTEQAKAGRLDIAIGRERELEALIDILGKRRANNPILVGPPGVGKTAIVEGLAVKIARGDEDVAHFRDRYVVSLDTGAMVAGTSLRGAFSERLGAIKDEVARADRRIVVFIDELHTLIGAGSSGEGAQDAANELKAALARGEFPCIGATTHDEFKKYIEKDPALERRFTPITVNEPTPDEALLILEGAIAAYADHHQIAYSIDAVHAAVMLSHRFINERNLPDKAFAVVDLAGSRCRRRGSRRVEHIDIARVVHEWSGVPLERLAGTDADRFARAENIISQKLIGHPHVVETVSRAIRRGFAGFNGKRPIASFLFLGPTGVGKTEMVKILAEFLFGRRDAIVRVDMSEYAEQHSVARLIGAQPGYVGYEEGGQLTEKLRRRPFQIILFDEIEKAHKDVLNILLQILDEGHLTDSRGRRVSFVNTLVVLTSNLGAGLFAKAGSGKTIGFGAPSAEAVMKTSADAVLEAARSELAPELWGRLDERLVFEPLSRDQVRNIATLQLGESAAALFSEREITMAWDDKLLEHLLDSGGFVPETGARGMRHTIQRLVEAPLAERVLAGDLVTGDVATVTFRNGGVDVVKKRPRATKAARAGA